MKHRLLSSELQPPTFEESSKYG